jgi:ubiquinone/menaquinone biosynthesis C-methylase UbiE
VDKFEAEIEQETRRKYSGENGVYKPAAISHLPDDQSQEFSQQLLRFKLDLVQNISQEGVVLDVGCGNGLHAIEIAKNASAVYGVDYSDAFIAFAENATKELEISNVRFYCENARSLPFAPDTFDVVYCFAALYYMPVPLSVIFEMARVMKPGGKCVLEFGNINSLNSIVCRHYPELATSCHITVKDMKRIVRDSGLMLEQHYRFQLLPMWADRPGWMRLLLHPRLNRVMSQRVGGLMLDEWICKLPILRSFAFRHILVCEKPNI